jgi:hypothetical protein
MTERQDHNINMTTMPDDLYLGTITAGLQSLNEKFGNNLSKDSLLKTGGYAKHDKNQSAHVMRNRNSADTLNYATVAGAV